MRVTARNSGNIRKKLKDNSMRFKFSSCMGTKAFFFRGRKSVSDVI